MSSVTLVCILLLCPTKSANHLNPIIISKIALSVNGSGDEKLMRGKCSEKQS